MASTRCSSYRESNKGSKERHGPTQGVPFTEVSGKTELTVYTVRERLSEKVHATIPKGIVGGFEFTVIQRNLKEWHERPWMCVCEC